MKKTILFSMVFAMSFSLMAQLQVPPMGEGAVAGKTHTLKHNQTRTVTDTMGWNMGMPLFYSPTAELHTYTMTSSGAKIGYWFGVNYNSTNSYGSDYWAQCYVNTTSIGIEGVLAMIGGKYNISSSANSLLTFTINKLESNKTIVGGTSGAYTYGVGPSDNALSTVSISINDIDTLWNPNLGFNYLPLPSVVGLSEDFAIVANFNAIRTNTDTAYMLCDATGNGLGLHYTMYSIDPASYYWVSTNFATSGTLDVNMTLFAVIDANYVGINSPDFYQGMKMSFTNPARNSCVIDYALQNNAKVKVDVISLNGQIVKTVELGNQTTGNHSHNLDVNDLGSGTYFISLNADGNRLTKKLVIE